MTVTKRVRIITGPVDVVEAQLETLLDEYAPTVWSFEPMGETMHATIVLIHTAEIRKASLARIK